VPIRKTRILVFSPPALSQVIRHLFRGRPEFEIVGSVGSRKRLAEESGRLFPELIVANWKPVRTAVCAAVLAIKCSSPSSKLILISPLTDMMASARRCGADACLEEERLVFHLLRTVSALSARRYPSRIPLRKKHPKGDPQ
jgi:hypothetical protein